MTYFGFLIRFLLVPIIIVAVLLWRDRTRGILLPLALRGWPAWAAVLTHVVVAVLYTTPWDNYLVATRVWWYDPALVAGITIGWVPLEEYTFFVLQSLLTGMWLLVLAPRLSPAPLPSEERSRMIRVGTTVGGGISWVIAVALLMTNVQPATYLALELAWALPPIMLQLAVGADILWRHRRLVLASLLPMTLFLSFADALAINYGTWTINPEQSLNLLLAGVLPVEEFVFFLLTNTLLVFGMTLVLSPESQTRIPAVLRDGWRQLPTALQNKRL